MKPVHLFTALTLASFSAHAQDVRLPARVAEICVGKAQTILQSRTQVNRWTVNGRTSNLSTFFYKGQFARLRLDVDEANVIAQCRAPGREVFQFQFRLNFSDPNTYNVAVRVDCVPCAKAKLKAARKNVAAARQLVNQEQQNPVKLKKAVKEIQEAEAEIADLLESGALSPAERTELQRVLAYLRELRSLILEGAGSSGAAQEIFELLERGLEKIEKSRDR